MMFFDQSLHPEDGLPTTAKPREAGATAGGGLLAAPGAFFRRFHEATTKDGARTMPEHFNNLRPDEADRLAMLSEEAGEIVQAVGKILRHGFDSHHPDNPGQTNRDLLTGEVEDLLAVIQMMRCDFNITPDGASVALAILQKRKFTHHQD